MPSHKDQDFLDFVLDQLSGLRRVSARRMFGAIGLYQDEYFFAIIDEGRLYFRTDESTRKGYKARGMKAFEYAPGKLLHSYYEVPVEVLEDDAALREWALASVTVQKARTARQPRSKGQAPRKRTGRPRKRKELS